MSHTTKKQRLSVNNSHITASDNRHNHNTNSKPPSRATSNKNNSKRVSQSQSTSNKNKNKQNRPTTARKPITKTKRKDCPKQILSKKTREDLRIEENPGHSLGLIDGKVYCNACCQPISSHKGNCESHLKKIKHKEN